MIFTSGDAFFLQSVIDTDEDKTRSGIKRRAKEETENLRGGVQVEEERGRAGSVGAMKETLGRDGGDGGSPEEETTTLS